MLYPTLEKTHFLSITQVFFREKSYIYLVLGKIKALEFYVTLFQRSVPHFARALLLELRKSVITSWELYCAN
jgi:uncharacterized membrane protein